MVGAEDQFSVQRAQRTQKANIVQQNASTPEKSVWVNASAGTGKTKVLTDRLIRLMLPRQDGQDGTPPHRILCLTYTKAGAGEMLNRIMKILSEWSAYDDEVLQDKLHHEVLGQAPTSLQIKKAREIFAQVIDAPGGMKIMTIHSFCQSTLGRFPIEANLSPDFTVLSDSEAAAISKRARDRVLNDFIEQDENLHHKLALIQNAQDLAVILQDVQQKRQKFQNILHQSGGRDALIDKVYALHGIDTGTTEESLFTSLTDRLGEYDLYALLEWLSQSTQKKDMQKKDAIDAWLHDRGGDIRGRFEDFKKAFVSKGKLQTPNKALCEEREDLVDVYMRIGEDILAFEEKLSAFETCMKTGLIITLGAQIIEAYTALKQAEQKLDYDDLILLTAKLLEKASSWVMFKLDGGIDHVLVDEAQDTSPEQWRIISKLVDDFFDGLSNDDDAVRTLFVVGDEKQSIYSFMQADPAVFHERRNYFKQRILSARRQWDETPLNISFRSTQSVLDLVDRVFDQDDMRSAATGDAQGQIHHEANRMGQAGHIEFWPLVNQNNQVEIDPWQAVNPDQIDSEDAQAIVAERIASTLAGWIRDGETLTSTGEVIRPGDVMILVRNRGTFVEHMIRALKNYRIPVNGIDRMVLGKQIAVQDLCAAGRFALAPEDDLTLACLLKSPFIGLSEEMLFNLAYDREDGQSLWWALKKYVQQDAQGQDAHLQKTFTWLLRLIEQASQKTAFDFFCGIAYGACPQDEFSGLRALCQRLGEECVDPLEEFINSAFDYDLKNRTTLQAFLQDFERDEAQLKREMEEGVDAVRIMTVHGSKGLQAPIVFLPDTILSSQEGRKMSNLLWPDQTGLEVPLWSNVTTQGASQIYKDARAAAQKKQKDEYQRLLYVALTRAEDRLYITGYKNGKMPKDGIAEDNWYESIRRGVLSYAQEEVEGENKLSDFILSKEYDHPFAVQGDKGEDKEDEKSDPVLIVRSTQHAQAQTHKTKELMNIEHMDAALNDASFFIAPEEEINPVKPLQPSKPLEDNIAVRSPLKNNQEQKRFGRGILIHNLLQFLPDIAPENRHKAGMHFIEVQAPEYEEEQREDILREVLAITEGEAYHALFLPGTKAEVPITGKVTLPGQSKVHVISGQIDRLMIDEDQKEIWVVDYKTNRPPPRTAEDIQAEYRQQMLCYRLLLSDIYEGYAVRCFLLWTDQARLMEVPFT